MKVFASLNLKTRAVAATGGILFLALALNTTLTMYSAAGKYREAVIDKTTAFAEGLRKDIDKMTGFGLPLNALEGMSDKLRGLAETDKNISRAMILDFDGRVVYTSEHAQAGALAVDAGSGPALSATASMVQEYEVDGEIQLERVIPLTGPDGKKMGVFRVAIRGDAVNGPLRALLLWSLLSGALSFVGATFLVMLFMQRVITDPLT